MSKDAKEKKPRPSHTKTIVQRIMGKRVVSLLPDEDKAAIMEWLLQLPKEELVTLVSDTRTPMFVVKCATMLQEAPLTDYLNLMVQCKENGENMVK